MIERKQTPPVFKVYTRYKPYLRLDFFFRCAYCGITEYRWGSDRNFVVEHFRPKSRFPKLACTYSNLYYACNRCNDFKSDIWPSALLFKKGYGWADPCASEVYVEHLSELEDGTVAARTNIGEYTRTHLRLNGRPYLVQWRRERRELIADVEATTKIIERVRSSGAKLGQAERRNLSRLIHSHQKLCERLRLEY